MPKHDDPLHWGTPILFQEDLCPIGTPIRVESNHEAVVRAAQEIFGRYGKPRPGAAPRYRLRVCVDPVEQASPPWPKPVFRSLNHLVHIACGGSNFAVADLDSGVCIGFVTEAMVEDASFFKSTFLDCLFYVLAVHNDVTPVHCAGVVSNGRGALICGVSGAGKTTLAYACVRTGLQVLADDVAHLRVDSSSGALHLWGRPWFLRLLPNAAQLFPELAGLQPRLRSDHEWYLEIDVEHRFPGSPVVSCQPEALVFLDRQPDAPIQLRQMNAEAVLRRFLKDIYASEPAVTERHREVLTRLSRTKAFMLTYSGDPSNAVEVIRSILDDSRPEGLC